MTCTITGTGVLPDGSLYASAVFRFVRNPVAVESQDGQVVTPKAITTQSDASGDVSFDLLPGNYVGTETATNTSFAFTVPDAASADWADCVAAASIPSTADFPATGVTMTGGGTAQDYAGFATRAAFVTWAAGVTPAVGTIIDAAGFAYRYIGSGTAISDLAGWVPVDPAMPDHWAQNTTPGTTNMATAQASWLAYLSDLQLRNTSTISHPAIKSAVTVNAEGSASPLYRIRQSNADVSVGIIEAEGEGFGVTVDAAVDGYRIRDGYATGSGWIVYIKPGLGTGGVAENGIVSGMSIYGLTDTAKVGIGWDGDSRNGLAIGNIIRHLPRVDASGRPAHAYAVAGDPGDAATTLNSENILFAYSVVDDINGNGVHVEDACPRIGSVGLVMDNIVTGVEIINDEVPYLQYHMGHMITGWSSYAIDAVGTGSSQQMTFADMLIDGTGSSTGIAMRINQSDTNGIVFARNHIRNLAGDGLECTAQGRVIIDQNTFFNVTGDCLVGRSTATTGRGLLVTSTNCFVSVGGIIDKTNSANLMGDQVTPLKTVVGNVVSEQILFHAKRAGFITKVTEIMDPTPLTAGTNGIFSIYKRTSGGTETKMIDNTIPNAGAAYAVNSWTAENAQIEVHTWDVGDLLILRSDGGGSTARTAQIQMEYFEYN